MWKSLVISVTVGIWFLLFGQSWWELPFFVSCFLVSNMVVDYVPIVLGIVHRSLASDFYNLVPLIRDKIMRWVCFWKTKLNTIEQLFTEYMDNMISYIEKTKVRNLATGQMDYPNEQLMRSIEEKIDISELMVDDFRRQIAVQVGMMALHNKKFYWDSNPKLAKALKDKLVGGLWVFRTCVAGEKYTKYTIVDVGKVYLTLNIDDGLHKGIVWPDTYIKANCGQSSWGKWQPSVGDIGTLMAICHRPAVIYLLRIWTDKGAKYVPIGSDGVKHVSE